MKSKERWRDLPEVMQEVCGEAGSETLVFQNPVI